MHLFLQITATLMASIATFFLVVAVSRALARMLAVPGTAGPEAASTPARSGAVNSMLGRWSVHLSRYVPESLREDLARKITMAGGLTGMTPALLVLYAGLAMVVGFALGALMVVALEWQSWLVWLCTVGGAALPFVWLRDRVKSRQQSVLADLPYQMDLLTLSVEAGLDFGAGISRVVARAPDGALRREFAAFLTEVRMGKTRAEAMGAMGERVGLDALNSLLSALIQADRMGSGLGRTLRAQAEQLRQERAQRAEKLAGEAPVKMLIPLVLFIFPTIWIILGAPLVFEWIFKGSP